MDTNGSYAPNQAPTGPGTAPIAWTYWNEPDIDNIVGTFSLGATDPYDLTLDITTMELSETYGATNAPPAHPTVQAIASFMVIMDAAVPPVAPPLLNTGVPNVTVIPMVLTGSAGPPDFETWNAALSQTWAGLLPSAQYSGDTLLVAVLMQFKLVDADVNGTPTTPSYKVHPTYFWQLFTGNVTVP